MNNCLAWLYSFDNTLTTYQKSDKGCCREVFLKVKEEGEKTQDDVYILKSINIDPKEEILSRKTNHAGQTNFHAGDV